jgi:hypothetical protein
MRVVFLVFGVMEITASEIFFKEICQIYLHEILLASKHLQMW